jgi:hypothetical protein
MNFQCFLEYKLIESGDYTLIVYRIFAVVLILVGAKIFLWSIKKVMHRQSSFNKLDQFSNIRFF